jgi:Flp pilus assembly pilin Flp
MGIIRFEQNTRKGKVMRRIRKFLKKLGTDEKAISSVEYALLLAFIAAGIIAAAETLSNAVDNEMTDTANCIEGTLEPTDPKCDD